MDVLAFRGAVFGRYRTQSEFCDAMGWHRNKVSKLMRGKYMPDVDEAAKLSEKMGMTIDEYQKIFLPRSAPNGDKQ